MVDDIGTIIVIALFFSSEIAIAWLAAAAALVVSVVVLQRLGVRLLVPYVVIAGLLWLAIFESGVHATIAGVILGFLTPAFALHPRQETAAVIGDQLQDLSHDREAAVNEATMWEAASLAREAVSPLARMETLLHLWSAYVVLPLFALANAGVAVSLGEIGNAMTGQVGIGIFLGLVVGAPLGGVGLAWILVRARRTGLPRGLELVCDRQRGATQGHRIHGRDLHGRAGL